MNNISNSMSNTIVMGTSADDSIDSSGDFVSINAGEGNNYISSGYGKNVSIISGAGNDTIIDATYGMGAIGGNNININSGAGNDSISNYGDNVTINAGDGNDTIYNSENNIGASVSEVSISGGAGNDYISSYNGVKTSINGGIGNDTISVNGYNNVIEYASGDGNDVINNLKMSDIIQITSGSYTTTTRGDDLIIKVGSGQMTLKEAANRRLRVQNADGTIDTLNPNGKLYTYNSDSGTVLRGSSYNDTINNTGSSVTIEAGAGDDYIYKEFGNKNISISGGTGNDSINCNGGSEFTVNGGTGDDTINLDLYHNGNSGVIEYKVGDGKDIIYGYSSNNTIEIADSSYTTTTSGNDVIINVDNGNMTLKDAFGKTLNIATVSGGSSSNSDRDSISNSTVNTIINGTSDDDTINNVYYGTDYGTNVIINGLAGNDYINNTYDKVSINGGASNDTISNYPSYLGGYVSEVSVSGGAGNDYIVYNKYTKNMSINGGVGNDTISADGFNSVIQYANGDGKDVINNLKMSDIIQITSGSYTTTTRGDDLIIKVGSGQMTLKEAANRRLRVQNANGTIDTLNPNGIAYIYNNESDTLLIGSNLNDTINNLGSNVTINAGVGDDSIYNEGYDSKNISISGGAGNDTIMCRGDELTINGGTGDDTIRLFVPYSSANNSVIQYANGDGKDIIYSYNSTDTIEIAGSSYTTTTSGNDVIISVGSGKMTLKNAFDYTLNIVTVSGGTSTNTETNTETTTTKLPTGLKYNTNKTQITVSTKFKGDTVDLSEYATTVKTVKATSFNKTLKISGNDLGNKITVGKKATTVYGGEGNDTITGGKGADVLYGDEGNDKIKGGSGADTLVGGAGADTLTGGAGKDVFVYEDGNDIITDYKAGQDSIMIEDEIEAVSVKGSNVIFTIGDGSLTVKGGKNKKITFIDSEGEVISNDKYTKSTKVANFVESPPVAGAGRTPTAGDAGSDYDYWFAADENFTTAEIDAVDNLIKTKSPAINLTELNVDFTSINQNDKSQTTLAAYNKINNSYF